MFKIYRKLKKGEQILVATDTAGGGGDYTASQFFSLTKLDLPIVFHSAQTTSSYVPTHVRALNAIYDETGVTPVTAFERNNGGNFLMDRVDALNIAGKYTVFKMPRIGQGNDTEESNLLGWSTNSATRPKMLAELQDAIDGQVFTVYDKPTLKEMLSFIKVRTRTTTRAEAERGSHDDLVMSLAIVWQMYQLHNIRPQKKEEQKNYDKYEKYRQDDPYSIR